MTVVGFTGKGLAECCWFDDGKKEHRAQFPEAALIATPVAGLSDEQLRAKVENELLQHESKAKQPKKTK